MDSMIAVDGLSKLYRLGSREGRSETFAQAIAQTIRKPLRTFRHLRRLDTYRHKNHREDTDLLWALRDVSFRVEEGEVLGIIGRNGAGKSTLLKVLSRITHPSEGRVRMRGRLSALLEVGTGFHPELTGRENIYLNGTILGMRKREIDRKFDAIVDFSGVERFLDTPVKRYSSGMKVRLAFSVAAHLEPEILLVDEVLSVGDAGFQRKCLQKMEHVTSESGRTVLFVSHNMLSVQALCTRVIWLDEGKIVFDGKPDDGVNAFLRHFAPSSDVMGTRLEQRQDREGRGGVRLTQVTVETRDGSTGGVPMGDGFSITLDYQCEVAERSLCFGVLIHDKHLNQIFHVESDMTHGPIQGRVGPSRVACQIEALPLLPGQYPVGLFVRRADERGYDKLLDYFPQALMLEVLPSDVYGTGKIPTEGQGFLRCSWRVPATESGSLLERSSPDRSSVEPSVTRAP